MSSLVVNRILELWANGDIDFGADTFKVLMTTDAYVPNVDTHDYRNDVTNEVVGTGYTAGGNIIACTVSLDTTNNWLNITFAGTTWLGSTLTGRRAVYYKSRGGASSADEIIAVRDFGSNVVTAAKTFNLIPLTVRINNLTA